MTIPQLMDDYHKLEMWFILKPSPLTMDHF